MFYSAELLTRKGAYAHLWLAGTHQRITRAVIRGTDIVAVCNALRDGEGAHSLRLRGTLLLGVSVILLRKTELIQGEVDDMYNRIRVSFTNTTSSITLPRRGTNARSGGGGGRRSTTGYGTATGGGGGGGGRDERSITLSVSYRSKFGVDDTVNLDVGMLLAHTDAHTIVAYDGANVSRQRRIGDLINLHDGGGGGGMDSALMQESIEALRLDESGATNIDFDEFNNISFDASSVMGGGSGVGGASGAGVLDGGDFFDGGGADYDLANDAADIGGGGLDDVSFTAMNLTDLISMNNNTNNTTMGGANTTATGTKRKAYVLRDRSLELPSDFIRAALADTSDTVAPRPLPPAKRVRLHNLLGVPVIATCDELLPLWTRHAVVKSDVDVAAQRGPLLSSALIDAGQTLRDAAAMDSAFDVPADADLTMDLENAQADISLDMDMQNLGGSALSAIGPMDADGFAIPIGTPGAGYDAGSMDVDAASVHDNAARQRRSKRLSSQETPNAVEHTGDTPLSQYDLRSADEEESPFHHVDESTDVAMGDWTYKMLAFLQRSMAGEEVTTTDATTGERTTTTTGGAHSVVFNKLTREVTRKTAARSFYQCLVLASNNFVHLAQRQADVDIIGGQFADVHVHKSHRFNTAVPV